jgi:crotonobetainyl-CoA:carnitine CoA-transferase CaiB-like acyl-CoA transferase
MQLSETPGYIAAPAPLMGEHTMDVCERIIGLNMDEIADLLAEGVLV